MRLSDDAVFVVTVVDWSDEDDKTSTLSGVGEARGAAPAAEVPAVPHLLSVNC